MTIYNNCIILVGMGAPTSLYAPLAQQLSESLPNMPLQIINWWEQEDVGAKLIEKAINDSRTLLIAHSAGGVIGMQTLAQFPEWISRLIMLDTHALKSASNVPTIEKLLQTILHDSNDEVKTIVRNAYKTTYNQRKEYDASVKYTIDWANTKFDDIVNIIKSLPDHTVLHIGFTDNNFNILDAEGEKLQSEFWEQYHIDTQFIPINHFDLVIPDIALHVVEDIMFWLDR